MHISQNFDFQIAITFLCLHPILIGLHGLIRACVSDSLVSNIAVPFNGHATTISWVKVQNFQNPELSKFPS